MGKRSRQSGWPIGRRRRRRTGEPPTRYTLILPPGQRSPDGAYATAINERGDVAGNVTWARSGIVHRSAFRWRAGTVLLSEPVTEANVSVARIDDHGRIAGTIRDSAGGSRAVTWRP